MESRIMTAEIDNSTSQLNLKGKGRQLKTFKIRDKTNNDEKINT